MERAFDVVRTVFYMTGFVGLWVIIGAIVRSLDPVFGFTIPYGLRPLGMILAFAGSVVAFACAMWFALDGRGTPAPFDAPHEFVADGPYRFVRNPMYLGAALVIAGCGILLQSPAITALAIAFLVLAHFFVVKYEEPGLRQRFGTSYRQYCQRVPRWLPRPPAASR